ncbi:MAG: phosphatase PAP2 family protein [Bryobacterales bacterium]|nr:phosphatase PAP2 family protein [Bryobacterales bacterium]
MLGFIAARDLRVMRRCNNWMAPRWIRLWMICATRGGDGWLWYAVLLGVLLFGGTERFHAAGASAASAAIGIWVFLVLKKAANRPRPCAIAPHAWATLLPPDQFSFPSGHTMTAFAVATPLLYYYPDLSLGLLFCAVSVAVSRILLGMHFLSDVVAGAVLGAVLGCVAVAAI